MRVNEFHLSARSLDTQVQMDIRPSSDLAHQAPEDGHVRIAGHEIPSRCEA
jgi:hypothetical protein